MKKTLLIIGLLIATGLAFAQSLNVHQKGGNITNFKLSEIDSITFTSALFEDEFNDLSKWTLYGDPSPLYIANIHDKNGIFDNNGDPNYNSGGVSKESFSFSANLSIKSDVFLDFNNLEGCWAGVGIGIADPIYQNWGGYNQSVYIELDASGDACWATQADLRRHAYVVGGYQSETGWVGFGDIDGVNQINADAYANKWVELKIDIDPNGIPSFYLGGNKIYQGTKAIANSIRSASMPLWLGSRSSGSAGKAYHDNIKIISN